MNGKYLFGFCLILVIILSCGCASAAMEQHNFGNDFSMEVPKNSNFEKLEGELYDQLPFEEKDYLDEKNQILVVFCSDPMISDENVDCNYDMIFKTINSDLDECYEYFDGNLKILEPKKKSENNMAVIGQHIDNNTVILVGNDVDSLKEMAKTISFE